MLLSVFYKGHTTPFILLYSSIRIEPKSSETNITDRMTELQKGVKWSSLLHYSVDSILSRNSIQLLDESGIDLIRSSLLCEDYSTEKDIILQSGTYEPIIYMCSRWIQKENRQTIVIANRKLQKLIGVYEIVDGRRLSLLKQEKIEKSIIDLSSAGDRWEGDCQGTIPCGWGDYYDDNNNLIFRGFRYGNDNVCYGTYYFPDMITENPEYEGQISFSQRFGKGKLFDREGKLELEDLWLYNELYNERNIVVPDATKTQQFHNSLMSTFAVGSECYQELPFFVLRNCQLLCSITVGGDSYSKNSTEESCFGVSYCPFLQSISISSLSFVFYSTFYLHSKSNGLIKQRSSPSPNSLYWKCW